MKKATTAKAPSNQIEQLEADITFNLVPGSVKGGMKAINGGEKLAPSRDLWQCDPLELRVVDGLNPRVETESYLQHLRDLAESMKSEGFYQDKPLAGYVAKVDGKDVVFVYEGGSRLRSAIMAINDGAQFTRVPVSVSQDGVAMEDILVAMVRGNTGRPLSAFETGLICKRLMRYQWDEKTIAARLGVSKQHVANLMSLMNAPQEIRHLVATEKLSASTAIEMIAQFGEKALEKIMAANSAAERAGKDRITPKFVPGASLKKAIKRSAPEMFAAIEMVKGDPGFASLAKETQEKLADLITELELLRQSAEAVSDDGAPTVQPT